MVCSFSNVRECDVREWRFSNVREWRVRPSLVDGTPIAIGGGGDAMQPSSSLLSRIIIAVAEAVCGRWTFACSAGGYSTMVAVVAVAEARRGRRWTLANAGVSVAEAEAVVETRCIRRRDCRSRGLT